MDEKQRKLKRLAEVAEKGNIGILKYLFELEEKIDEAIPSISALIKRMKGDKGDSPTEEQLLRLIRPLIPEKAEDGHTPTKSELLELIKPLIPQVEDGKTPSKEELISLIKPLIPEINTNKIISKCVADIEKGIKLPSVDELLDEMEKRLPKLSEPIRDSLELLQGEERLDKSAVKGLDELLEETNKNLNKRLNVIATNKPLSEMLDVNVLGLQTNQSLKWNGREWIPYTPTDDKAIWGEITGTLTDQTDLTTYIADQLATQDTLQEVTDNGATTTNNITVGGLTDTSLTAGSVPFIGAGGLITEDNSNFFWDDTNKRLGIGTDSPTSLLDVDGDAIFNKSQSSTGDVTMGTVDYDDAFFLDSSAGKLSLTADFDLNAFRMNYRDVNTTFPLNIPFSDSKRYLSIARYFTGGGGAAIQGWADGNRQALAFQGHVGTTTPTDPAMTIEGWKWSGSGTSRTPMVNDEFIVHFIGGQTSSDTAVGITANGKMSINKANNIPSANLDVGGTVNIEGSAPSSTVGVVNIYGEHSDAYQPLISLSKDGMGAGVTSWGIGVGDSGQYDGFFYIKRNGQQANSDFYITNSGSAGFGSGLSINDGQKLQSASSGALAYYVPYDGNTESVFSFRGAVSSGEGKMRFQGFYNDGSYNRIDNVVSMTATSDGGRLGVNLGTPSCALDINSDKIRLRTSKTPSSATDTGNQGDIAWDSDYIYVCTATDTWKRSAISTW